MNTVFVTKIDLIVKSRRDCEYGPWLYRVLYLHNVENWRPWPRTGQEARKFSKLYVNFKGIDTTLSLKFCSIIQKHSAEMILGTMVLAYLSAQK